MMTDPEPYDSNDNVFASVNSIDASDNQEEYIPATLRFISNIPLPPIEDKKVILLSDSDSWKSAIPNDIHIRDTIQVTLHFDEKEDHIIQHTTSTSLQTLLSLIDTPPTSITMEIPYSISINHSGSNRSFMKLDTSMGEGELLTNYLLKIPNRQTVSRRIQRRSHQSPLIQYNDSTQTMIESLFTIGLDTLFPTYSNELETLQSMGFINEQENYRILTRTLGNVEAAVNILVRELE